MSLLKKKKTTSKLSFTEYYNYVKEYLHKRVHREKKEEVMICTEYNYIIEEIITYLCRFLTKVLESHPEHMVSLRYVGETVLKMKKESLVDNAMHDGG